MLKVKMDTEDDGKVDHYIGIVHFNDWFYPIKRSVTEENFGFDLKFLSTTDPRTFMNDTIFNIKVLLNHAYFNYVGKGNEIRGNRIPYV